MMLTRLYQQHRHSKGTVIGSRAQVPSPGQVGSLGIELDDPTSASSLKKD
jgi:hypothetical protein